MVKRSLYSSALLSKMEKEEDTFFESFAKNFLEYLENLPLKKRIKEIKALLFETEVKHIVSLSRRLTEQEKKCLYLAAKGKTISETANILDIQFDTAKEYRNQVIKKLKARNLPSAITLGIKYKLIKDC